MSRVFQRYADCSHLASARHRWGLQRSMLLLLSVFFSWSMMHISVVRGDRKVEVRISKHDEATLRALDAGIRQVYDTIKVAVDYELHRGVASAWEDGINLGASCKTKIVGAGLVVIDGSFYRTRMVWTHPTVKFRNSSTNSPRDRFLSRRTGVFLQYSLPHQVVLRGTATSLRPAKGRVDVSVLEAHKMEGAMVVTSPHPVFYGHDWFGRSPLTPYLWYLDPENNSWREGMNSDFVLTLTVKPGHDGRRLVVKAEGRGSGLGPSGHTKKILTFRVDGSVPVLESSEFYDYRPGGEACALRSRASGFWATPSGHLLPKSVVYVTRTTKGVIVRYSEIRKTWSPPWPQRLTRLIVPRGTMIRGVKPDAPGVTVTTQSATFDVMKLPPEAIGPSDALDSSVVNAASPKSGVHRWGAFVIVGFTVLACLLMARRWRWNGRRCGSG